MLAVFQSSVLVEELTGHNPIEDILLVKIIDELGDTITTHSTQKYSERSL